MIMLLGDAVRETIVNHIKSAKMYGISADTTPDLSKKDQMAVVCRYIDMEGDLKERLVAMKCVHSKTGDQMADDIISTLNSHSLKTDELCFQSYDFTSSMSGRFNGCQKKLQDKLRRAIPYSEVEECIKEVEDALKLRNLSKTRWTARPESIRAVWISFEQTQNALCKIKESAKFDTKTKASARSLHSKMESADFIIAIMFMKNIMMKSKLMTEALQAPDLNIIDAMTIICSTVHSLKRINEDSEAMNDLIEAGIQFTQKVGGNAHEEFKRKHRVRRRPTRIEEHPETDCKMNIIMFYRRGFKEVLEIQIMQLGDNLNVCFEAVRPLAIQL
eukprot:gene19802-21742_t